MKKTSDFKIAAKKITPDTATYNKLKEISVIIDDEWLGTINANEAVYNISKILQKKHHIIKLNKEMSYRCVECMEGYILQYNWWEDNDWIDVTDLTELKIWEHADLVNQLREHYPDYPIEHLEGRFV